MDTDPKDRGQRPVAEIFWDIHLRGMSGRLELRDGAHEIDVTFVRGVPVEGRSTSREESLIDFLASHRAPAADGRQVDATDHAQELIRRSFRLRDAKPVFSAVEDPGTPPPGDVDMFGLLRDGVYEHADGSALVAAVQSWAEKPVVRTASFLATLRRVKLTRDERRVLHAVDGSKALAQLEALVGIERARLVRLLYLAHCVRLLGPAPDGSAGAPPGAAVPPEPTVNLRASGAVERPSAVTSVAAGDAATAEARYQEKARAALALDGYFMRGMVGQGGFATVYRAYQDRLDRMVAIKVPSHRVADDFDVMERFHLEARSAAKLNHPNIVMVHDVNARNGIAYLVMELVEGTTLKRMVELRGPLPEVEAIGIAVAVAEALEHAHAKAVLHRDVKPENLFLCADGRVKLGDWGLARSLQWGDADRTGSITGTPGYMSPEQLRAGSAVDHRADVYALGGLFYFLLTASSPYKSDSVVETIASHLVAPPPDPRVVNPTVSDGAAGFIYVAMAKEAEGRYQTAAEVKQVLEALAEGWRRSAPQRTRR